MIKSSSTMLEKIKKTVEFLNSKGIVDRCGHCSRYRTGSLATKIENIIEIKYKEIPNSGINSCGHEGKLIFGEFGRKKLWP